MIRISPIRVVGPDNEQIGVIETADAIRMAQEKGLDLVEIVSDSRPPVCKIMDYGKYRYELSKKEVQTRANSKRAELKEVRLGRSMKIDPHDVGIRIEQARRFLLDGHKVQFVQRFRGREIAHKEIGMENLRHAEAELADISKVELPARLLGKAASMVLAPDKVKIEALRRKEEQAKAREAELARQAAEAAEAEKAKQSSASHDQAEKPKKKGTGDDRDRNPIDDELNALLGG